MTIPEHATKAVKMARMEAMPPAMAVWVFFTVSPTHQVLVTHTVATSFARKPTTFRAQVDFLAISRMRSSSSRHSETHSIHSP